MFSIEMLEKFYDFKEDANFEVDDEVKKAYFVFIKDFCSCVSRYWRKYLEVIRVRDAATFVNNLTPSDECYALWYLKCNYEREEKIALYSKTHSKQEIKQFEKEHPKGVNHSIEYFNQYCDIFDKIEEHRVNAKAFKHWQHIFLNSI